MVTVQAGQFFDRIYRINKIFSLFCYQILKILLILSKFAFRLNSYGMIRATKIHADFSYQRKSAEICVP